MSTSEQEDGSSLATQEQSCQTYAREHDWQIAGVYSDTYSGASLHDRKGLTQLREAVRTGAVTVVLAHAIDRVSRSQAHLAVLMSEWEQLGCRLELVTERFEDTATGRFILAAKSFAAEVEREKNQERVIRGLRG